MDFGAGTYAVGLLAGAVSILSPCVLPLVPILVASALSNHRFGTVALALGLSLSFTAIGLFLATIGTSLGLDADTFRRVSAVLMLLFGFVMLSARLQAIFVRLVGPAGASGQKALSVVSGDGLGGQFMIGLLLGLVWSPCVGPTLGAASTLAAQGSNLGHIALLMALFGIGAALPLLLLGTLSRASMNRVRQSLNRWGQTSRWILGAAFVGLGALILTGFDRELETLVLSVSPTWLTVLTTSF